MTSSASAMEVSEQNLLFSEESRVLTPDLLEAAFQHVSDRIELGDVILDGTGTLVRLPSLEGVEMEAPLSLFTPNPFQVRQHFDEGDLKAFGERLRKLGQQVAVQVVPYIDGENIGFFIVDGERRWRASRYAERETLRMVVKWKSSIRKIFAASVIANQDRVDNNPIELANAYQQLIEDAELEDPGCRGIEVVSRNQGRDVQTIETYLKLLELPEELQQLIIQKKLNASGAHSLLRGKMLDKRTVGMTDDRTRHLQLEIVAQQLLASIAAGATNATGGAERKKSKRRSKTGALTQNEVSAALEVAVQATQGDAALVQLKVNRALLKALKGLRTLEMYLPFVTEVGNRDAVVAAGRRLGISNPPEAVIDMVRRNKPLIDILQSCMEEAALPELSDIDAQRPNMMEYIEGIDRSDLNGHDKAGLMIGLFARATCAGRVMTLVEVGSILGIDSKIAALELRFVKPVLEQYGLVLESYDVRIRTTAGGLEKAKAYRLNWAKDGTRDTHTDDEVVVEQPVASPKVPSPESNGLKGSFAAENRRLITGTGVSKEVRDAVLAHVEAYILRMNSRVHLHPGSGSGFIFSITQDPKRPVLHVSSNIQNFEVNLAPYIRTMVEACNSLDTSVRGVLLHNLRNHGDIVEE